VPTVRLAWMIKEQLKKHFKNILMPSFPYYLFFFFPHVDVSYDYVVDQQPIGNVLFRQFCENKRPEFHKYVTFLESVSR